MQPGEPAAVFNDALSRLSDRLTYLYSGNRRYWYDTQPNLRRTMEERASGLDHARACRADCLLTKRSDASPSVQRVDFLKAAQTAEGKSAVEGRGNPLKLLRHYSEKFGIGDNR